MKALISLASKLTAHQKIHHFLRLPVLMRGSCKLSLQRQQTCSAILLSLEWSKGRRIVRAKSGHHNVGKYRRIISPELRACVSQPFSHLIVHQSMHGRVGLISNQPLSNSYGDIIPVDPRQITSTVSNVIGIEYLARLEPLSYREFVRDDGQGRVVVCLLPFKEGIGLLLEILQALTKSLLGDHNHRSAQYRRYLEMKGRA